jgi:hypothetical protein
MPFARDIGREHADLAVGDLARGAGVLPRHTAGCLALLQKARLVNHQDGVILRQVFKRILAYDVAQRIGIPATPPQDRLLPPGTRVTGRFGPHPACLAPLLPQQPIKEQASRPGHPLLREQGAHPRLYLPKRCRPKLQHLLDRCTTHPASPNHPGEAQSASSKTQL